MHDRPERDEERYWQQIAFINEPHFFRNGEPRNRPRYRPGDLVLIYLSGTHRCFYGHASLSTTNRFLHSKLDATPVAAMNAAHGIES